MSSFEPQPTETEPAIAPRRSWLGGALSLEFAPCHAASLQLAAAAHDLMKARGDSLMEYNNDKPPQGRLYLQDYPRNDGYHNAIVATPLNVPVAQLCDRLIIKNAKRERNNRGREIYTYTPLPVAVVRNIHEDKKVLKEEIKEKWHKKKTVQEIEKYSYRLGDVWLADMVAGGKVLMQIAGFELREDGNCSYVHVGQEITDDSVVAVQSDDENRLKLIEDLRKLVVSKEEGPKLTDRVRDFIKQERERNAPYLTVALGAWVAAQLQDQLVNGTVHHNALIENDDVLYQDKVRKHTVAPVGDTTRVSAGVLPVDFEASQPITNDAENALITLSAVARQHVGFPIAQFFPATGEAQLIGAEHLSDVERYKCMLAVVAMIDPTDKQEFASVIEDPDISPHQFLMTVFKLEEQIGSRLRPHNEAQEQLVRAIGAKALDVCYSGTVHDVNMDTTRADFSGNVRLQRVDEFYQAHIAVRLARQPGKLPPSEVETLVYDPTLPLTDNFPTGQDAKEFRTLIDGFNTLESRLPATSSAR